MNKTIKEFKIKDFDKYDFSQVYEGSPVFFGYQYRLEDICGKVVHISERRKIINIEFTDIHYLNKILKNMYINIELDLVHTVEADSKLVKEFVVHLVHGNPDNS